MPARRKAELAQGRACLAPGGGGAEGRRGGGAQRPRAAGQEGRRAGGQEGAAAEGRRAGGQEGRRAGGQEGAAAEGRRAGGQEGRRAAGQEGRRAGGQEGRRAGGQEGRRAGGQEGAAAEGRRAGGPQGKSAPRIRPVDTAGAPRFLLCRALGMPGFFHRATRSNLFIYFPLTTSYSSVYPQRGQYRSQKKARHREHTTHSRAKVYFVDRQCLACDLENKARMADVFLFCSGSSGLDSLKVRCGPGLKRRALPISAPGPPAREVKRGDSSGPAPPKSARRARQRRRAKAVQGERVENPRILRGLASEAIGKTLRRVILARLCHASPPPKPEEGAEARRPKNQRNRPALKSAR